MTQSARSANLPPVKGIGCGTGAVVLFACSVGCTGSQTSNPLPTGAPAASTNASGPADGASTSNGDADESTAETAGTQTTRGESASSGTASTSDGSGSTGEPIDPDWQAFLDARVGYLESLAEPILECAANEDSDHPAFDGCIDWHSNVHALYSLHVLYRVTGNQKYLDAAEDGVTPTALAAELVDVQSGELPQEIPYGYAWFLLLAIEREETTGSIDMRPLAGEIAQQLSDFFSGLNSNQIIGGVLADDYANISWAALNLWRWAQFTGDDELSNQMETFASEVLLDSSYDQSCPLEDAATEIDSFFSPCLHRLLAITTILPQAEHASWAEGFLTADLELEPLGPAEILAAHQSGLNFSRAWGLWAAYRASGDRRWRDQYVDHVRTHVGQPEFWAENYWAYSHWVAQFGVHAIDLSYDAFP